MDLTTAYTILGVPEDASLDQVKARYRTRAKQLHPDTSRTSDPKPFILLTAAYTLILERLSGDSAQTKTVSPEVLSETHIDERVHSSFIEIKRGYEAFFKRIVADAKGNMRTWIHAAGSSSELETVVSQHIRDIWVDLVNEIESEVTRLCERAFEDDKEFLFSLFRDLYDARRRYWWSTLYRNPFLIISLVLPLVCAIYPHPPMIVVTDPWIPLVPLGLCLAFLVVQYQHLDPRKQFMPPSLSLAGIQATLRAVENDMGIDRSTATVGGAGGGAIIGTFLAPGPGTLVGAAIGGLLGLFMGESLNTIKERVETQIMTGLDAGLQQLNRRVLAWIEQKRSETVEAAHEAFASNILKVGKLLTHRGFAKQVTFTRK